MTAVAVGTATITATSEGKTGTSAITVTAPPPAPVATVTVAPPTLSLQVGQTGPLTATTRDAANNVLTGRAIAWSSGTVGVATVAPNGTVTAVAPGTRDDYRDERGEDRYGDGDGDGGAGRSVTVAPPTLSLQAGLDRER